jgi:hypothetical protein
MKNSENGASSSKPASVRGKYANLLKQGTNIAILDPDIVDQFPDSESVNNALRAFLAIGKQVESAAIHVVRKSPRSSATPKRNVGFDPRVGTVPRRRAAAK